MMRLLEGRDVPFDFGFVPNRLDRIFRGDGDLRSSGLELGDELLPPGRRVSGKSHKETLRAANNYADTLTRSERFEEARSLLRKALPVANQYHQY